MNILQKVFRSKNSSIGILLILKGRCEKPYLHFLHEQKVLKNLVLQFVESREQQQLKDIVIAFLTTKVELFCPCLKSRTGICCCCCCYRNDNF